MKISDLSDIELDRWREYPDILTDSLWQIDRRDDWGPHSAGGLYHGNFIPQIPHQLLRRYTKPGDWVCDPFMGGGTTLIEAARLHRHGFGIEINETVARWAFQQALVAKVQANSPASVLIAEGDCSNPALWGRINTDPEAPDWLDFLLLHPPYWDIVKFNPDEPNCLSNADTVLNYVNLFGHCCVNLLPWLKPGRFGALVIGDCYKDGEWITLGDECWRMLKSLGMTLKAKVIKNVGETKGKGKDTNLWRYRALAGGFYKFAHEYLYIFQKPEETAALRNHVSYKRPGRAEGER